MQALLAAEATHPAYGSGVRHIRRWCRNFALLPSSFTPIEIQEIQLESEEAQISTGFSDVHRGAFSGKTVAVKSLRVYGLERSLPIVQKVSTPKKRRRATTETETPDRCFTAKSWLGVISSTQISCLSLAYATNRQCVWLASGCKRVHCRTFSTVTLTRHARLM
jgi:hypothetical protein